MITSIAQHIYASKKFYLSCLYDNNSWGQIDTAGIFVLFVFHIPSRTFTKKLFLTVDICHKKLLARCFFSIYMTEWKPSHCSLSYTIYINIYVTRCYIFNDGDCYNMYMAPSSTNGPASTTLRKHCITSSILTLPFRVHYNHMCHFKAMYPSH